MARSIVALGRLVMTNLAGTASQGSAVAMVAPNGPGLARPELWVNLFTAVQVVGALLIAYVFRASPPLVGIDSLGGWAAVTVAAALAVSFLAAETFVFHVEYRREAMTFSLAEVPLAFALVFLSPPVAVLARVVGSLAALLLSRQVSPNKLAFNTATFMVDTLLAVLVLRTLVDVMSAPVAIVAALIPAIALANTLSGISVAVVVSCFEGRLWSNVRTEVVSAPPTAILIASGAALTVAPAMLDARLAPLAALPTIAFWFIVRLGGAQAQHNRDLLDMHSFARVVGRFLEPDEVVAAATGEITRLLRASKCRIVLVDPVTGAERCRVGSAMLDNALPTTAGEWRAIASAATPLVTVVGDGSAASARLVTLGLRQTVMAAAADEGGTLAFVMIADRDGVKDRFEPGDLIRLSALADQLALSLRRAVLHEDLAWGATHDAVTGLSNRTLLERAATTALESDASIVALAIVSLDRVGEVNETLGHEAGDTLLRDVALRLDAQLEPGDLLARLDGHRLAVLANRTQRRELGAMVTRLEATLAEPVAVHGVKVALDPAVGVAHHPEHGSDVVTLLRRAEIAVRDAVDQRSGHAFYRPETDEATTERLALLGELRHAIDHDELEVYFQPKIDLADGALVGAEALVRWHHPERGLVPPDRFIPLAERTGLMGDITAVVLSQALRALESWDDKGLHLGISVNLSIHNLLDEFLPERLARLIAKHELDPAAITLEITESNVMTDADRSLRTLYRLAEIGVRLSIDDYGTGYSSLTYLRELPVDELKIDRSFVTDILRTAEDEVIVRSTIDLAHQLGLQVVAEGVEDRESAVRLGEIGCDGAQGFGISRPLCAADFAAFVETWRDAPWGQTVSMAAPGGSSGSSLDA